MDITDEAAIRYLALKVDDIDNGNESTGDVAEDDNDDDDSDDDDVDEDLHKMATEIATKTDDSGFCSNRRITPSSRLYPAPGHPGWARCLRIH